MLILLVLPFMWRSLAARGSKCIRQEFLHSMLKSTSIPAQNQPTNSLQRVLLSTESTTILVDDISSTTHVVLCQMPPSWCTQWHVVSLHLTSVTFIMSSTRWTSSGKTKRVLPLPLPPGPPRLARTQIMCGRSSPLIPQLWLCKLHKPLLISFALHSSPKLRGHLYKTIKGQF